MVWKVCIMSRRTSWTIGKVSKYHSGGSIHAELYRELTPGAVLPASWITSNCGHELISDVPGPMFSYTTDYRDGRPSRSRRRHY